MNLSDGIKSFTSFFRPNKRTPENITVENQSPGQSVGLKSLASVFRPQTRLPEIVTNNRLSQVGFIDNDKLIIQEEIGSEDGSFIKINSIDKFDLINKFEKKHVIIDLGSSSIKSGFADDDGPRCIFPSIVGHSKYKPIHSDKKNVYVGNQAQSTRGILSLQYPLKNGLVSSWDAMEQLIENTFSNELRIDSKEHPVLLTDHLFNTRENREKMLQLIFETFETPRVLLCNQQMLSVFGCGKVSGVGFDCGEGRACSVPVDDGNILQEAVETADIGGSHLTEYLGRILQETGYSFNSTAEREIVKDLKEKLCYVALDFDQEEANLNHKTEKSYELPDGNFIYVSDVRFRCPEVLFQPEAIGLSNRNGIHYLINDSLNKIKNTGLRNLCFENIILCGGSTMFLNIEHRLSKELKILSGQMNLRVDARPERKYLAWIGGSIFSSLTHIQECFISLEEYNESGAAILEKVSNFVA